ncbi:substrate-binding domain-containing protein [Leifsonia sp. McL0607]|uniref:substrate-binding domain-containing protein n=1 Tax=Leifsonia sp. McL0607 TaxID=3415672 RepID=UPI003CFB269C
MTDQGASIGLVIRHDHDRDPVASAIVRAIAGPLVAAGMRFITRSVDDDESELRTYRLWARVGGIAGVIVLGAVGDDPRIRLLRQIDLPFVALARTDLEVDYPAVVVDPSAAAQALTTYLEAHDALRWVYVTAQQQPEPLVEHGPASETPEDRRALEIVRTSDVVGEAVAIGSAAVERTVLILDGDRDAVAVLEGLLEAGAAVPGSVSLICWSDSLVCQSASRPITAIDRHGREIGELLGTAAIDAINGEGALAAAPAPLVVERETT